MESSLHTVLSCCDAEWDGCKYTPLAAIGMLNIAHSQACTCNTSNCSEDTRYAGNARNIPVNYRNGVAQALKDGLVFDYIQRIELKSWTSYRPLGQIALDMALVHIAWDMDLAKKYSSARQMLAIHVDCVIVFIAKVQYENWRRLPRSTNTQTEVQS